MTSRANPRSNSPISLGFIAFEPRAHRREELRDECDAAGAPTVNTVPGHRGKVESQFTNCSVRAAYAAYGAHATEI